MKARNYFTHYDIALAGEAAKGAELYHLYQKLSILLEACLLGQLGFPADAVGILVRGSRPFKAETQAS